MASSAPETFKPERPSKAGLSRGSSARKQAPLHDDGEEANTRPKQLDFYQAMRDFQNMFPLMDPEVIEAVLRANNGAVDATIDQLLTMNIDSDDRRTSSSASTTPFIANHQSLVDQIEGNAPPSYNTATNTSSPDTIIAANKKSPRRSPSNTVKRQPLPGVTDRLTNQNSWEIDPRPPPRPPKTRSPSATLQTDCIVPRPSVRTSRSADGKLLTHRGTHSLLSAETKPPKHRQEQRWHPPLLGALPADFLRIVLTPNQAQFVSHAPLFGVRSPGRGIHSKTAPSRSHLDRSHIRQSSAGHMRILEQHHQDEIARRLRKTQSMRDSRAQQTHQPPSRELHRRQTLSQGLTTESIHLRIAENERRLRRTSRHADPEMAQILEDERMALRIALQNEDFLRELRANPDFMKSLHQDGLPLQHVVTQYTSSSSDEEMLEIRAPPRQHTRQGSLGRLQLPVSSPQDSSSSSTPETSPHTERRMLPSADSSSSSEGGYGNDRCTELGAFPHTRDLNTSAKERDDSEFKLQLKNMGSSSKRKVVQLAKRFFSRRKRSGGRQILRDASAPSTMNLLDDNDDEDVVDEHEEEDKRRQSETPIFEPLPGSNWASFAEPAPSQRPHKLDYEVGGFHI